MPRHLLFTIAIGLVACTGETLGENKPGGDTFLEFGDIGVDERTETSFVLTGNADAGTTELVAVPQGAASSSPVEALGQRTNLRVLFPSSGVLVMSQDTTTQYLDLFDRNTLASVTSNTVPALYNGTRMSPSRDWVAVADNTQRTAPINILDVHTLQPTVVPHGGDWLEAMWLNNSDTLVAIVFYDEDHPSSHARIMTWKMTAVQNANFMPDSSGFWPSPDLDIDVPGVRSDFLFSYTWVGISPDDSQAVFPVLQWPAGTPDSATASTGGVDGGSTDFLYTLLVVDLSTGNLRQVPNAKGPVGFTPDGKTIVSYTTSALELINSQTLEVTPEAVPINGGLIYFTSHEGNQIVVGKNVGSTSLVLFDVDNDSMTTMNAPGVELDELVERLGYHQLWLVDAGALWVLDLAGGSIQQVAVSYKPTAINILPEADRLVLDQLGVPSLFFFNPDAWQTTSTVPLGGPVW